MITAIKTKKTIIFCVVVNIVIIPLTGLTIYGGIEKNDIFLALRTGLLGPVYLISFLYLIIPSIIVTVIGCSVLYEIVKRKPNLSRAGLQLIGTGIGLFFGLFVMAVWGPQFEGDAPSTTLMTGGGAGAVSGLLSTYICLRQWNIKQDNN